jgi:predicted small secreted protein
MPSGTSGTPTAEAPVQKSDFEKVVEEGITSGIKIDPNAERDAQAKWAQGIMGLTPEQRAVYQQGITEREQMYKEQYDPKRQAREELRRFLLGAGGRRWGVLGGGAQASMDYEDQQNVQRRKDFEDLQKARETPIGTERSGIPALLNLGSSAHQSAQNVRERALGSGATLAGVYESQKTRRQQNELREQIAKISEEAKKEKDPLKTMEMTTRVKKLQMEMINDDYDRGVKALFPMGVVPKPEDMTKEQKTKLTELENTRETAIKLLEEQLGLSNMGKAKDDITKYDR